MTLRKWLIFGCIASAAAHAGLGLDTTVGNAVGIGTFVPGYRQMPSVITSLSVAPHYDFPVFADLSPITATLEVAADINWIQSYDTAYHQAKTNFLMSDVTLDFVMNDAVKWDAFLLAISPSLGVIGAISPSSRGRNRVFGYTILSDFNWSLGNFGILYRPSFIGWIHSSPNITSQCFESVNFSLDDYMLGQNCLEPGRQSIGVLKNKVEVSFKSGAHKIALSTGWYVSFLRPIDDRPEWRAPNSINQSVTHASVGKASYTYKLPVEFDSSVKAGVISSQAAFDKAYGAVRFPFFDFFTPGNNLTQLFVELSASV